MLKALFFDLDGTLLDTINDIKDALNAALKAVGLPLSYGREEVRSFIGNGSEVLLRKALGQFENENSYQKLRKAYLPLYQEHQRLNTYAFEGVNEVLQSLAASGLQLFVCTNKPDHLAKEILQKALPEIIFASIDGQRDGIPPKPNPAMLNKALERFSLKPEECLFIGDSLPDILTAQNGKMKVGICLWGYGIYDENICKKANYLFKSPADWLKLPR